MKKTVILFLIFPFCILFAFQTAVAQCTIVPLSLEQRISKSGSVIIGLVTEQHTYRAAGTGNINTLNKIRVNAWLKNYTATNELYVITEGGVLGNEATIIDPSLQLGLNKEYVLMLQQDNTVNDDKSFRRQHPEAMQVMVYADQQGAMQNNNNNYYDIGEKMNREEASLLQRIQSFTGEQALKPSGEQFQPRQSIAGTATARITAISGFSPTTTRGGTIDPSDFITITGSGFGAAAGTVFFTNSDDGGATFTSSGVASDIVSWSDASITVKVAQNGGTGPINVNGAFTSASNLTVNYGHTAINSTFSGFGSSTRQRYYHRNMNGLGGYTYLYNTTSGFSANAPAVAAFERAMATWRCGTFINWRSGGTTASGFAADGVNVVMFDGTLPVGVLGRATSRFSGSATGLCNLANTVWCVSEIDIQFFPDPPVAGFPWEYGPALPSFSEYDFETVALHELGHHHGLQHVISPGAVMHYAIANGTSNRVLSGNDVAGGAARMTYSTAATCFNPAACGTGPMTALTSGNCSTLPVNLLSFTGEKTSGNKNKLQWKTNFEQNNRGYYIERSSNGTDFGEIGFVNGAGNTSSLTDYYFEDNKTGPYDWYYRLRISDMDHHNSISSVVFIKGNESAKWKVWPGLGGEKIYLYKGNSQPGTVIFSLFSAAGQQVMSEKITAGYAELNAGRLLPGVYFYRIQSAGYEDRGKIIVSGE
jgi:hypothetical protein